MKETKREGKGRGIYYTAVFHFLSFHPSVGGLKLQKKHGIFFCKSVAAN